MCAGNELGPTVISLDTRFVCGESGWCQLGRSDFTKGEDEKFYSFGVEKETQKDKARRQILPSSIIHLTHAHVCMHTRP